MKLNPLNKRKGLFFTPFILFIAIFLFFLQGCGASFSPGTVSGNPPQDGLFITIFLVNAICELMTVPQLNDSAELGVCHPELSFEDCTNSIYTAEGIDKEIGLEVGSFSDLGEVFLAESEGRLILDPEHGMRCVDAILNLGCEDDGVLEAWNSNDRDNFNNIYLIFSNLNENCPYTFELFFDFRPSP